jgi:hypothetical protein
MVQAERIGRLMEDLLGRKVNAKKIAPMNLSSTDQILTAVYESDEGNAVAACACDLDLVINAGAALCLIPVYEVQAAVKAKKWEPSLVENFKEVLNICARLFCEPGLKRVKLGDVCFGADPKPAKAAALLAKPAWRVDVELSITGYGTGRMMIAGA